MPLRLYLISDGIILAGRIKLDDIPNGYHIIHLLLPFVKAFGNNTRRDDGMVCTDLAVIEAPAFRCAIGSTCSTYSIFDERLQDATAVHLLTGRDIVAVGTGITYVFLLIQRLHLGKHIRW